ncbi:glutamyl-tRNA amidotransferase subunit b [Plasmodium yoelii yoelii]|uniref:Glutamyl-tRNA(Gln) amidotransferase subunit B n=3 Tax=Plasmodium yoelii TaxID=5861 RepID=A0AAE9WR28_PLAYO|nr:glutamyl-tRNA amidotransferase subunit b [Plasmodium yoelii yoelii]WBY58698.1 glutamyl-tRNA(Gln) amidotransferase subunit B [Plasmodium yoelii yoelii]
MFAYIWFSYFVFFIWFEITCFKINTLKGNNNLISLGQNIKNIKVKFRNSIYNHEVTNNTELTKNIENKLKYQIGIEMHVQLSTKHKAFCNCFNISSLYKEKKNEKYNTDLTNFLNENILKKKTVNKIDNYNSEIDNLKNDIKENKKSETNCHGNYGDNIITKPNEHICNICVGEVGSLNLVNITAILYTYLISIILNCNLSKHISFDRKIYNYYDLPKGYQITQKEKPLGSNGYIYINGKKYNIKSVHLEEDTSKSFLIFNKLNKINSNESIPSEVNDRDTFNNDILLDKNKHVDDITNNCINSSCNDTNLEINSINHGLGINSNSDIKLLLDYNRCGIPLAEIVIEKGYMNIDDCINLLKEIKNKICLLGVCVGNKENIRSDINISFEYENIKYNRIELKNINSFTKIRNCIELEKQNVVKSILENYNNIKCNNNNNDNNNISSDIYTKSYVNNTDYFLRKKEKYNYVHEGNIPEYKINNKVLKLLKFYVNYKIKIYEDQIKYKWSNHYFHVFFNDPFLYNYFNECLEHIEVDKKVNGDEIDEVVNRMDEEKSISNFIVNTLIDILKKKNMLSKKILIKPKDLYFLIKYSKKNNLDKAFIREYLYKYIDIGFDKEALLEKLNTANNNNIFDEMHNMLKNILDENIKYLQIDDNKNILNEQNFKNRIIGILKNKINQEKSLMSINYTFVNTFISDYIKKILEEMS